MFGTFIKELRAQKRLGLREFCLEHGHDPSNWSKVERDVLPPPKDEDTLRKWARQLGLKPGSDDWHEFFNHAAVDAGRIPDHVLKDKELVEKLPAFFRTLSGQKPSREDLEKLLEIIVRKNAMIANIPNRQSSRKIAFLRKSPLVRQPLSNPGSYRKAKMKPNQRAVFKPSIH